MLHKIEQLTENSIHIWKIQVPMLLEYIDTFFELLSEKEKESALKYRLISKKRSYILTKAILKLLLQKYLKNKSSIICKNDYDKPYIKDEELYFNISHTKDLSLIAFSKNKEIGIDLENKAYDTSIIDISSKYFTKIEQDWIKSLPLYEKLEGFLYCWVRKEAYIKARGFGLSLALDSFDVINQNHNEVLPNCKRIGEWYLFPLDLSDEHLGAICIKAPNINISYFNIHEFM